MIRFERTDDVSLIRSAIGHPKVFRWHTFDGGPTIDTYQPLIGPGIVYVRADLGNTFLGIFEFVQHNPICWEVHTALLPSSWGEQAAQAVEQLSPWVWANTPCRHIFTKVPEDNPLALRLARTGGMREFGTMPKSFPRDGKLLDQTILCLYREAA